jgi:hypothetical protein
MFGFASPRRFVATLGAASLVGACSVADSFHVDPAAIDSSAYSAAVPTPCRSTLGSYALPKSLLRIKIQSTDDKPAVLITPATIIRPDKALTFCLDHISDPLADDQIRIIKASGQDGVLYPAAGRITNQLLVSGSIETTRTTASSCNGRVNTVGQSSGSPRPRSNGVRRLSGNSKFTPLVREFKAGVPATLALFEYDPFDPAQSALHNRRLRDFGYCLVLENFTFDTRAMAVEQYCSSLRYESFPFEVAYARYRSGPPPRIAGVAYRPRINYALSVYRNVNPNGRGSWRLDQQYQMPFENIAPIVSIGLTPRVRRAPGRAQIQHGSASGHVPGQDQRTRKCGDGTLRNRKKHSRTADPDFRGEDRQYQRQHHSPNRGKQSGCRPEGISRFPGRRDKEQLYQSVSQDCRQGHYSKAHRYCGPDRR